MHALLASNQIGDPHPALLLPLVAWLLCLATLPIRYPAFWQRHCQKLSLGLGLIPVAYYLLWLHAGGRLLAIAWEYVSFMILLGSSYVVAGGIHIRAGGALTPRGNLLFLLGGGLLANLVGTTGASMLLIRPWLRLNRQRYAHFHTAFFIFMVGNVGGCLTPLGDPPLFFGYLKGIPFWWLASRAWPAWALAMVALGGIFYLLDRRSYLAAPRPERAEPSGVLEGWPGLGSLALVLGAMLLRHSMGLREALMIAAALGSYRTTARAVHEANRFTLGPIREVAWVFAGLFATMVPALDYLEGHAVTSLGIKAPRHLFWSCGLVSGVLGNAPAYLALLAAALRRRYWQIDNATHLTLFLQSQSAHVLAISLGSVLFGGLTYLGNGPNLLVKAVAEEEGFSTPSFFRYIYAYSLPVLLPILALVGWIFFAK